MRTPLITILSVAFLTGCAAQPGNSVSALTGPTAAGASASTAGQQLNVVPPSVSLGCFGTSPFTATATTNFAGAITASASGACTVTPSIQDAATTPGSGGLKSALFTVFPSGSCVVTFTDKKGNTAKTTMDFSGSGGDCI